MAPTLLTARAIMSLRIAAHFEREPDSRRRLRKYGAATERLDVRRRSILETGFSMRLTTAIACFESVVAIRVFALVLITGRIAAQTVVVGNQPLRLELLELARDDQADREEWSEAVKTNDQEYIKRFMEKDAARTLRLKAIIADQGWPTPAVVGAEGVRAAWLVLQHSADSAWQKTMLPVLERAAAAGEMSRGDVALLTDRVFVRSGRPQRYGSSFSVVDGRLVADPIEDESQVDVRRAEVGLPSMAEYARTLSEIYKMPVVWPRKN